MSQTNVILPPGQFRTAEERQKYEMDPANFDKLDPASQARVANLKFNSGQFMGVAETKIIEAGIPGSNGDGVLSKEELETRKAMIEDREFMDTTRATICAATEYGVMSAGATIVTGPDLNAPFGQAAQGVTPAPQNAPQFTPNNPGLGNNGGMNLALNSWTPKGPMSGLGL